MPNPEPIESFDGNTSKELATIADKAVRAQNISQALGVGGAPLPPEVAAKISNSPSAKNAVSVSPAALSAVDTKIEQGNGVGNSTGIKPPISPSR